MFRHRLCSALAVFAALLTCGFTRSEELPPIPPIKRLLPPEGVKLPDEERAKLVERNEAIKKRLESIHDAKIEAYLIEDGPTPLNDITIFTHAIDLAFEFNEFYEAKKDLAKTHALLDEASRRLDQYERGKSPWRSATGLIVRGIASGEPYGMVVPADFDPKATKEYPLYVWLHGRGDQATNLHFLAERMKQVGQLGPVDAIVIHPFGRQCVGFKSAGEMAVLKVIENFLATSKLTYRINTQRVLIGFSMGGAGAWHIGAHYPNQFVAVCPGAGFAETALYTNTDPAKVPEYERKLWGCYDVPNYTRNLFNSHVIAYSGEKDKQIQAARVMENAFKSEGRELTHLIGPGVAHAYEPKTLAELKERIAKITSNPEDRSKRKAWSLQTRTLRYNRVGPIELLGLERHWEDSRADLQIETENEKVTLNLKTKNVARFRLAHASNVQAFVIDGQEILSRDVKPPVFRSHFEKTAGEFSRQKIHKQPGLQGPIDDAFMGDFIVVAPSGKSKNPLVQRWVEFEMAHFVTRWKALMREVPIVKKDTEITRMDEERFNLICFGDPDSNTIIRRQQSRLPITWKDSKVVVGGKSYDAAKHVPSLIYPNPIGLGTTEPHPPARYIVINSGLTFREAHDKTNSQQNPKLPDWAVIDLTQLPDDKSPGRIAAAGFFDEEWKLEAGSGE